MNEEQIQQVMNQRIDKLFDLYPIEDLRPLEVQEEMKEGIAKSYAQRGFRSYLENAVKIALKNMAVAATPVEIAYYKSRVDVLEQLLAKGKQMFTSMESIRSLKGGGKHG